MANCRYCNKEHRRLGTAYCGDVCKYRAGEAKTLTIPRYGIFDLLIPAPAKGWVYGEQVEVTTGGYVVEVMPSIGGHTLYRARRATAARNERVIVVGRN
jgi:hypothetical protein